MQSFKGVQGENKLSVLLFKKKDDDLSRTEKCVEHKLFNVGDTISISYTGLCG